MKSFYFRKKEIFASTIQTEVDTFVFDYNYNKPCHKHRYFTPDEVHYNPNILNEKPILPTATKPD